MVEGDDALIACPTARIDDFIAWLEHAGMRVKYEVHEHPGLGGFCHQWWTYDHESVTAVDHRLRNTPYSANTEDPVSQLSARGISMLADWGNAPVLGAVARVLIQSDGWMNYNTYAKERVSLLGIPHTVKNGRIYMKIPHNFITPYRPSEEARALLAQIEPAWDIER